MMKYGLTAEERDLVRLVQDIARTEVAPRAAAMDEEQTYSPELLDIFREAGLFGIGVPEQYGGAGLGAFGLVLAIEQVARYCCATGLLLLLTRLPLAPILFAGTEEQKRRYAGGIAAGTLRGAFCLSEPNAGSDVAGTTTRAVRRGDKYVIDGTKAWISGAEMADFFTVAAKTSPADGARGMSVFIVDRSAPGVTVRHKERKLGVRGLPINQVVFEAVEVPVANRLGAENEGFRLIMKTLNSVRPLVAARGVGLAAGALAYWVEYARQRETFGQPLIRHQGLQWMMADLAASIEAARLLTYEAARLVDAGRVDKESAHFLSMAKLMATETAVRTANDCLQMMGAAGYIEDYPLARFVRDARQLTIVEGTSQIQKGIIARAIVDGHLQI